MAIASEKTLSFLSRLEIVLFIGFSFFLIPLSYYPPLVDPGLSIRFSLLAALIAVLAIVRWVRLTVFPQEKEAGIPMIFAIVFAGYFCISLLSLIPSINKSESVFEIAKVFLFCGIFFFASSLLRRRFDRIPIVANAVTISSLVLATLGIFEYWGVIHFHRTDYVSPGVTMINKNLLSSYLFLCLGLVLFVIIAPRTRAWRILGFIAYSAIQYILLATQTRAVWLGCFVGLLLTFLFGAIVRLPLLQSLLRLRRGTIIALILVPLICGAAVSLFKPAPSKLPSMGERAATIVNPKFESNNQRIILWRKTLLMSRDHPFLGVGAGNWKIVNPHYGIGDRLCSDFYFIEVRPYNDFLWVLAETGIFGLLMYGGLFLISALFCLRSLRSAKDQTVICLAALLLFTIAGFTIISFFDFPKERIEHLTLFGILCAVCASLGAESDKTPFHPTRRIQWRHHASSAVFFFGAIACLWIGIVRCKGDINDSAMRGHWKRGEWQEAIAAADRASSPLYTMEPTSTPLRWYRGVANFRLGRIDEALLDYRRAYDFHPWHLNVLNDLGTCYSLKGDQKRAMVLYSEALAVSSLFESTLINCAAIYHNRGQYDSAFCIINRCKNPHTDPRFEPFFKIILQKVNKRECP